MIRREPLEASLERTFFTSVNRLGGIATKIIPVVAGPPDRFVILNSRVFLVELKRSNGTLEEIQKVWHRKARARGVEVHTIYGKEGLRSFLKAVIQLDDPKPGRRPACGHTGRDLKHNTWRGGEWLDED